MIIYDVTDIAVNRADLQAANAKLETLSRTDRLTNLYNRGYWEERLEHEFRRFRRSHAISSLILFDVDHFKRVNDVYGHPAGDEVLRRLAGIVRESVRATDVAGRYGGEEFGLVLVDTPAPDALVLAERLRKAMAALVIDTEAGDITVTISLGVVQITAEIAGHKHWIECADHALYQAKRGGRNRTVAYSFGVVGEG